MNKSSNVYDTMASNKPLPSLTLSQPTIGNPVGDTIVQQPEEALGDQSPEHHSIYLEIQPLNNN